MAPTSPLQSLLVGKPAVEATLRSGNRAVFRLLIAQSLPPKRKAPFLELAEARNLPVEDLSPSELRERTGVENHGGVAAVVGPRVLTPFGEWAKAVGGLDHAPLLFAFENFHEPHNLGYALRCVEALGADGVLIDDRGWGDEDVVISQSSSGAFERMRISALADPGAQLKRMEEVGIQSLLATAGAQRDFYNFNLRAPVLIAVGGEFKGLSDALRKACRHSARLPMADTIPSFPAGHAAAILASEAARQRRISGPPGPLWPPAPPRDERASNKSAGAGPGRPGRSGPSPGRTATRRDKREFFG